jgi:hydrogenase assembly chaperone HypC/HupF
MCFTIPKRIIEVSGTTATIEGGTIVDIAGIEAPLIGDFVYVTSGIAIAKLDASDATSIRHLIKQTHDEFHAATPEMPANV